MKGYSVNLKVVTKTDRKELHLIILNSRDNIILSRVPKPSHDRETDKKIEYISNKNKKVELN